MNAKVTTITPEMAKSFLEKNEANRPLSARKVEAYADTMTRGGWQTNGEAIKFNRSGKLVDGQHRLNAIIKANIPVEMMLIEGVGEDVTVFDRGKNRSIKDIMFFEGYPSDLANTLFIASANMYYSMQSAENPYAVVHVSRIAGDLFIKEFLTTNADFFKHIWYTAITKSGRKPICKKAGIVLAVYYAYKSGVPLETLDNFLKVVETGFYEKREETSAITLRNDILLGRLDARTGGITICLATEKAISDFAAKIPRDKTYKNVTSGVYSKNKMFRIKKGD